MSNTLPILLFTLIAAVATAAFAGPATAAAAQESLPVLPLAVEPGPSIPTVARRAALPSEWSESLRLEISRGGSAPLVWFESGILVASLDRNVHLVSLDGPRVVWKENYRGGFEAEPVVTEDRIYLSETRRGARLLALDRDSHRTLWTADAGDLMAPPILTEERLYTVSSIGEVKAFDRAGVLQWSTELGSRVQAGAALLDGVLVIAASDGHFYAVDTEDGAVRESTDPGVGFVWGNPLVRAHPATAVFATLDGLLVEVDADLEVIQQRSFPSRFTVGPDQVGGDLLLIGHEGTVWRYDWEGASVVWHRELPATLRSAPRVSSEVVALGSLEGILYLLDLASGETLWETRLDGAITSRPLARELEFFAFTESGTLYGFRPAGSAR
ncbi:MAG TPA: PQQ-binding-like beta-propeller repeat protein [Gemmatimonadota bacterium]|nr:PQQ-binding-like beta-propeller repeat protein [Gemmatimonadota bacterium]